MWYREAAKGDRPKRTYVIEGDDDQLDELERVLSAITWLSSVGASRNIKIYVDGDGAANIRVTRKDGNLIETDWEAADDNGGDEIFHAGIGT